MNEFGRMAMTHWARWLPGRYAQIPGPDREAFFARLGLEVAEAIAVTEETLLSGVVLSEDYLTRVGQLTATRAQARELVLTELVLLTPEPGTEEAPEGVDLDQPPVVLDRLDLYMDEQGMPRDPAHPLWVLLREESVTPEEFVAARRAWVATLPLD